MSFYSRCKDLFTLDSLRTGAQTVAVARDQGLGLGLGLNPDPDPDMDPFNVKGGAIALGHPLAATGVRLTITVTRQLKEIGARWGIASACIGLHRLSPGHCAVDRRHGRPMSKVR